MHVMMATSKVEMSVNRSVRLLKIFVPEQFVAPVYLANTVARNTPQEQVVAPAFVKLANLTLAMM